jgi:hypothetical protein
LHPEARRAMMITQRQARNKVKIMNAEELLAHAALVRSQVWNALPGHQDTEDIVHDAVVIMLEKSRDVEEGWLYQHIQQVIHAGPGPLEPHDHCLMKL